MLRKPEWSATFSVVPQAPSKRSPVSRTSSPAVTSSVWLLRQVVKIRAPGDPASPRVPASVTPPEMAMLL
jgi:hypothetical protein